MDQDKKIKTLNKNLENIKKEKEEEMKKAFVDAIKKHSKSFNDLDKKLEDQQKDVVILGEKTDQIKQEEKKDDKPQRDLQDLNEKPLKKVKTENKENVKLILESYNDKQKNEQISFEEFMKKSQKENNEDDISTIEDYSSEDDVDMSDIDTFEEDTVPIIDNRNDYDGDSSLTIEDEENNTKMYENFYSGMIYDNMRTYTDSIKENALELRKCSKRHYDYTKKYQERKNKLLNQEDYYDNERIYLRQIACNNNKVKIAKRSIQLSLNFLQDYLDHFTVYDTENHI